MAQLYTIAAPGVTFQLNKCIVGVFNGVGSDRVVRVYSITLLNNQTVSLTGVAASLSINLISTGSGGTAITPLRHDSEDELLPSQIITASNLTFTTSNTFRRFSWSTDEPISASANGIDEIETNSSFTTVYDSTLSLSSANDIQPITLREGQGLAVVNNTNTIVGLVDAFMVISVENN